MPRVRGMAGAGPASRVAKFPLAFLTHNMSPHLASRIFPSHCALKATCPRPFSPPNSCPSHGKKSMQAELTGTAVGTWYGAMPRLPHPPSKEQKVTLELAALSGHTPAVSRLPIYFPFCVHPQHCRLCECKGEGSGSTSGHRPQSPAGHSLRQVLGKRPDQGLADLGLQLWPPQFTVP